MDSRGRRLSVCFRIRTSYRKDIEEIPQNYLSGMEFTYVKDVAEVIECALLAEKVDNPITFE